METTVNINDIFYILLTAALPLVLRFVFQLINAKVSESKYADAVSAVLAAVEFVNQTYVDALKESGEFTPYAQAKALEMAKEAALHSMENGTRKWIEKSFDDLDAWLSVQIESTVKQVKETAA